jgi:hypothetical protein
MVPQFFASATQLVGVQTGFPQTFSMPDPPQVWLPPQVPHSKNPPHPSDMRPQFLPAA